MILKLPNLARIPKELRELVYSLREWAKERERFEKSITSGADTRSASGKLALKQGVVVDRTRVDILATGATVSTSGSLIPTLNNSYDVGSPTFRWRDLFLGRNADIDGNLDVAGAARLSGVSISGNLSMTDATQNIEIRGAVRGYSSFYILSDGSNTDLGVGAGVLIGFKGMTCVGPLDYGVAHSFTSHAFDGPIGVTGLATFATGLTSAGITTTSLNATRLAMFGGGISSTSVVTSTGQLQALAGFTCTGGVTIGGMVFISSAAANGFTGNLVPITTQTGSLGLFGRRWGNIFGGTLTLTNAATIDGKLTLSNSGTHTLAGTLAGGILAPNEIRGDLVLDPLTDGAMAIGECSPDTVNLLRIARLGMSGMIKNAKGADIASGTTLSFGIDGNYFDVTGTATVAGISYVDTKADPQAGIFNFIHLDSNPTITHHATRLQLAGSTDFRGRTNDHVALISDGSGSWREMFRSYRPMAYGQCTSGAGRIAWAQVNAAQNTWYRITDADMIDGVLSSVTHDGSGRLTVVTDGMYRIDYTTTFLCDTAATNIFTGILQNGTTIAPGVSLLETVTANVEYHLAGHAIYRLAVGNTIDIGIFTDSAGTPDLTVDYLDITLTQVGW